MSPNILVSVPCPKCGKIYRIYQTNLGRTGICKKCKNSFRMVPSAKKAAKKTQQKFPPIVRSVPPEKSNSKVKQVIEKQTELKIEDLKLNNSSPKDSEKITPEKIEDKKEVST
ncbi:hypothetical protein MHK_005790, partial [Candidatus Magnetomorum sp. HK-1]